MLNASYAIGQLKPEEDGHLLSRFTDMIQRGGRRMDRLIGDLGDLAAIESGRLSLSSAPYDPAALVLEVIDSIRDEADLREVDLNAEITASLPPVTCDRDRIFQVLQNLILNAVRVTPSGGHVTVGAEIDGAWMRFRVSDTGPGIRAEDLARLFRPYSRGEASYKGTGLGLSIAKGIVEGHGGQIGVDTNPEVGSTFWFTLPLAGPSRREPGPPK